MNGPQRRTGWPRAKRIIVNVLLIPTWVIVAFICIHGFESYSDVGNLILLALVMFFSLWAWWYSEDRDRRHGANLDQADSDGQRQTLSGPDGS